MLKITRPTVTIIFLAISVAVLTYLFIGVSNKNEEYLREMTKMQKDIASWITVAEAAMDRADAYIEGADSAAARTVFIERSIPEEILRFQRERANMDTAKAETLRNVILWRNAK